MIGIVLALSGIFIFCNAEGMGLALRDFYSVGLEVIIFLFGLTLSLENLLTPTLFSSKTLSMAHSVVDEKKLIFSPCTS